MDSPQNEKISRLYTQRHTLREGVFGEKPYANFGYWSRPDLTIDEACDAMIDQVAQAALVGPGDRVLEVGCGYGAGAVYYTRRYQPAAVTGIDVTDVRLEHARAYVAEHGLAETIQVRRGDATRMDFADGSFTKVLAVECAFHFDTRRDFFREAARVLAPGGRLAVADIIPRRGGDPAEFLAVAPSFCVHANLYDADQYAAYLREAGFDNVRVEPISAFTLTPFTDHLERVSRQTKGMRGLNFANTARLYRSYRDAGAEYVLASARKAS